MCRLGFVIKMHTKELAITCQAEELKTQIAKCPGIDEQQ